MKLLFSIFTVALINIQLFAQLQDNQSVFQNSADLLLASDSKLSIGGYGEIHYHQPLDADLRQNGELDVHRLVMFFGYNFSNRVQFVTEIEYEHVSEVYVEQMFLQYKLNSWLNFRGGLMLIPVGIINEYHEPTTFNGVDRPFIDNKISPTTWREIGFGITGNFLETSLKYQLYLVNGFNGYDGQAKFNGRNGLRGGRQKGAESYISAPNLTARVEYYGIRGLNMGLSTYMGDSQSRLYHKIDKSDDAAMLRADSSVVGIAMIGIDGRYNIKGWQFRGQYYHLSLSNTLQYNHFTKSSDGTPNDLGSVLGGFYVEAAYNVLRNSNSTSTGLYPFIRYEQWDTQKKVAEGIKRSASNENTAITTGISWFAAKGAVVKAEMQLIKPASADKYNQVFNAGIGVMF